MNGYWLAFVLGIIEGVTEFLPVSSTAHLRIAQALLGINLDDEYWKMFAIVIQLGAILSVVVYFWKRLRDCTTSFQEELSACTRALFNHPLVLTLVAFVVTAVPSYLLSRVIGENLESLFVIASALVLGGAVMWGVDVMCAQPKIFRLEEMRVTHALWIGLVQILSAVFPGTSRSMSTIAGGQVIGLSRAAALEFSFFVSIPTMFAATGYDLLKTLFGSHGRGTASDTVAGTVTMGLHEWVMLGIGFATSFLVAWAVIAWFMNWVRARGFVPFAIYRLLVGAVILLWTFSS